MAPHRKFHKFRPHPWHGLSAGLNPPSLVHAFIEITPFDMVKYEIDKESGFLRVDRPQRTSSLPPALYGFVPRTYCGDRVRELMPGAETGDHDPLDVCVISERPINRAETLLNARVVGGLPMLDDGEADDKIIAILDCDHQWGSLNDISELPSVLVERLMHYFTTYKLAPNTPPSVKIGEPYGREHAEKVVQASLEDYNALFNAGAHDGDTIDF